jgi:hypothetical protein
MRKTSRITTTDIWLSFIVVMACAVSGALLAKDQKTGNKLYAMALCQASATTTSTFLSFLSRGEDPFRSISRVRIVRYISVITVNGVTNLAIALLMGLVAGKIERAS